MPCITKCVRADIVGSCAQAPPELPIGTRDMLSTPAPTVRSAWPAMILPAANATASSPEPQARSMEMPGTAWSQSAASTAMRAMLPPCSPTGLTQPITTSSTARVSSWLRSASAASGRLASQTEVTSCRLPSALPLARGVRT